MNSEFDKKEENSGNNANNELELDNNNQKGKKTLK